MSTVPAKRKIIYPTSDGRPMAETDYHRDIMVDSIQTLDARFASRQDVYVSGNLLIYYVPGNKRKHISPDTFVVFGVEKKKRLYYLTWEEDKNPDVAIEITSSSTKSEDLNKKFVLYRDVLKIREYFLFDPFGDYLTPQLQGYRLQRGDYQPIAVKDGRLPSKLLGLHLEAVEHSLRFYDPETHQRLLTSAERAAQAEEALSDAQAEINQLRRELERAKRTS